MTKNKTRKQDLRGKAYQSEENSLHLYLQEISRFPLMKKEEEEKVAALAAKGNAAAREKLINSNLRFVISIAKKYQGKGLPLEDLISEGNVGLLNAVKYFNVNKGYRFITYAVWWIRQAIGKAINEKSRMIRLPNNKLYELHKIDKAREVISGSVAYGSNEEIEEIAAFLDISPKKAMELMNIPRDVLSMDEPVVDGNDSIAIKDFLVDELAKSPIEYTIDQILKDELEVEIEKLDKREAELIRLRYGLEGKTPMTLKQIGANYDLSKERVRQIERKALGQLNHSKGAGKLKSYIA